MDASRCDDSGGSELETTKPVPAFQFHADVVPNHEALYHLILSTTAWDERMRVRKTASYGIPYDYGTMRYEESPPFPPFLDELAREVQRLCGYWPNNCLLNYYPDETSSIGFHSDSAQNLETGTGVAIISLGFSRTMIFREKKNRSNEMSQELAPGSLLFMPLDMQDEWLHAVPKGSGPCGGRISVTLRLVNRRLDDAPSSDRPT